MKNYQHACGNSHAVADKREMKFLAKISRQTVRIALCAAILVASLAAIAQAPAPIGYTISLASPEQHLVEVQIILPAGAVQRELQLPVWNALYQVRDFAQYVNWIRARDRSGKELPVHELDKSRWQIQGGENGAVVEYQIFADSPGPFGAQLNSHHAFFNLAEILMYPVDARNTAVHLHFSLVPGGWRIAIPLLPSSPGDFGADNYDRLVDSPVELGNFQESDFDEAGGHFRVIVDADPADYDMNKIVAALHKIVAAATSWMNDRPFDTYTFFYHFPRGPASGGMEHAYSTAIDINAEVMKQNPSALTGVTAHEFFHLWNVKRIRPQTLEPVDYTKENYTRALWFSEGVTSTAEGTIQLRAGLLDEERYLSRLGAEISELEHRPAHLTQSAEESSLDAWLEGNSYYRRPERSISYYNKGELIGVLLDLAVRDATAGQKSLRDVFRWMNRNYAQKHKFYPDTEGVRQAVEAVTGKDFKDFFDTCVTHAARLPYNDYLKTVGLELKPRKAVAPYAGFIAERNFDEPAVVVAVDQSSEARKQGLATGDVILLVNGRPLAGSIEDRVATMRVGESVRLRVSRSDGQHDVKFKLVGTEREEFTIGSVPTLNSDQRARRAAWLTADDQKPKDAPKGAIRAAAPAAYNEAGLATLGSAR